MQLTITDVRKHYGDVTALDGPSFTVPAGSTFGLLGTNGAGKTTLLELLVGHDRPDAGTITVGDRDVTDAGHAVRQDVGFLPEDVGFPGDLTGREVLELTARLRSVGADRSVRIQSVLETVGLADAADRRVSGYSNGMGRRLGLAAALLSEPPVLLLDEPTAGLDPRGVATFHEVIERIRRETDATVVITSHVLEEIERLCDEVAILHEGRLVAAGSVDELSRATAERVRVRLAPADDGTVSTVRAHLEAAAGNPSGNPPSADESVGTASGIERRGETIAFRCRRETALAVASALEGQSLDHFSVEDAGLEAAFLEAVAEAGSGVGAADRTTAGAEPAAVDQPGRPESVNAESASVESTSAERSSPESTVATDGGESS